MELRHQFDLDTMLSCVKMARSTFYYYSGKSGQPDRYERVRNLISRIYHDHKGRFGYRRIALMLR